MMFDTCGMKRTVSNRGHRGCRAQWCGQTFLGWVVYLVGETLNIEITHHLPVRVVMAGCKQCTCMYVHCTVYVGRCHYYTKSRGKLCMRFSIFWTKRTV